MTIHRAVRPHDVLPDGAETAVFGDTIARKGSVAAFIANAKLLDSLPVDDPSRPEIVAAIRELVPALNAVGVFDVFDLRSSAIRELIEG
jgi:hypothetical protein